MNFLNQVVLADAASGNAFGTYGMILIWVLVFAAMYFFILRPSSKKKKEEAQMRNSLEIGDEITTIGGIMGRVVAIKDDEDAIIIETGSDRVKMKFKKWCISTVDTVKEAPAKEKSSEKEEKTEKKVFSVKRKRTKRTSNLIFSFHSLSFELNNFPSNIYEYINIYIIRGNFYV